ncbi:hypothetical protein CDL15_Pgr003570 [Punica granatum]|uniref:Uncharacterized protein n=2 Tax=Punica granatum TaxID=22663 RepID=A0A218XTM1_PUNGR|nr:hypothetical protein CDL15_Pgr003570 [Punica granatum]
MADVRKVRPVMIMRCPKCENVLLDYSVHQCGGCGAVLPARNYKYGRSGSDAFSNDKPHEEHTGFASEKSLDSLEIGASNSSDASDSGIEPNTTDSLRYDKTVAGWGGTTFMSDYGKDYSVLKDRPDHNAERVRSRRENSGFGSRLDSGSADPGCFYATSTNESKGTTEKWVAENSLNMKSRMNDLGSSKNEEFRSPVTSTSRSVRSAKMTDLQTRQRGGMEGFWTDFHISKYPDHEGSSVSHLKSSPHWSKMQLRRPYNFHGADGIQYLDDDCAALLRKIDELKRQLTRSCEVVGNPKGDVPFNNRKMAPPPDCCVGPGACFSDGSSFSSRELNHSFDPYRHADRTPYQGQSADLFPYPHRHNFVQNSYSSLQNVNRVHRSRHSYNSGTQCYQYPHQQYYPSSGRYTASNSLDPLDCYSQDQTLHPSACSYPNFHNDFPEVALPVPPNTFKEPFSDGPKNRLFRDRENQGLLSPLNSQKPQTHIRRSGDLNSGSDGFLGSLPLPQRVVRTSKNLCRPIGGAAPFFICYNCFELLQLPKKLHLNVNWQKIRCGDCSTIINCAVRGKKLVLSFPAETKDADLLHNNNSDKLSGCDNRESNNLSSNDTGKSGYEFHSAGKQHMPVSAGDTMRSVHSSSPIILDTKHSTGDSISSRTVDCSIPPPANAPVHEKIRATLQQESWDEEPIATEMELSFNEYSNTGVSQDSWWDMSAEDDERLRINEASLVNLRTRSFRDFSRSSQSDEHDGATNVSINGHVVPDSLVGGAEKLAGPIQPGDYWYDFRAGFWGAIGGPCLGIIPPFIEEFNYPMAEDCAGGTTGVIVNGRELHQQDLDLLSSRGLPTGRDRSYIVEISGRVLDEETGQELGSLGKLAPTVKKMKRGFGMKVPRTVAAAGDLSSEQEYHPGP